MCICISANILTQSLIVQYLQLTDSIGENLQIIGDTVFQTNPVRLENLGIRDNACNGVLLKPSQVGITVWEAIEISRSASRGQWGVCGKYKTR